MICNKLTLLTAAALMAQQVSGLSAHRHLHALEKRALDAEKRVAELEARGVVVETVWEYVTTTVKWSPGMAAPEPTAEAAPVVVQDVPAAPEAVPTTFAKVVVAEESNAPVVAAPQPEVAQQQEAPKQETPKKEETKPKSSKKQKKPSNNGNNGGSSSGSPFSGKRGIAYNEASLANTLGGTCKTCTWGYNWASRRDDFDSKFDFVPMLWGPQPLHSDGWEQNANDMISQGSKALLGFNEPDIASQANLSPSQAAQDHQTFMNGFSGKALIGAPAVSNSGNAGEGLDWLKQWVDACNGQCSFDFCPVHWYSQAQYADTLFTHLEKAHEICGGKPVWLTEFAPLDGPGDATDSFIKEVIPKLDQIDYLDAYSYFMVSEGTLMSGSSPNSAGQLYATVN